MKPKIIKDGNAYPVRRSIHESLTDPNTLALGMSDSCPIDKKVKAKEAMEKEVKSMCGGVRKQVWMRFKMDLPFKCDYDFVACQPVQIDGCSFLYCQMQATRTDQWMISNKVNKVKKFNACSLKHKSEPV